MADTFLLEVATPERLLVNEQVREAQIRPPTATWASCRGTPRCWPSWARAN